jgi:hypothetical protein
MFGAEAASMPSSSVPHPEQHCKQHKKSKGLLVKFRRLSCCSAPQFSNPSSPMAAPSSSGYSGSSGSSGSSAQPALKGTKVQPPKSNFNTPVKKTDQGPFASAWQQQQCDDVLNSLHQFDSPSQQSPGVQRELSAYFSEEFFDTRSIFSEASLLERQLSEQLHAAAQQALADVPAPAPQAPQTGPWVPETPLLFAGEGLAETECIHIISYTSFSKEGHWPDSCNCCKCKKDANP